MSVPSAATVDLKLEVVAIPVSDVDRAKAFYQGLGWSLDADFMIGKDFRAVQLTPPGSPCSIHLVTTAPPGSAQGMFLVVADVAAARRELIARGVGVTEVFHFDGDHHPVPGRTRSGSPIVRTLRSPTPTAIDGFSRRSRRGSPGEDSASTLRR
jgi:catechol 2,3-dioxygenase-like lactoylglutathione lyase family enzyme